MDLFPFPRRLGGAEGLGEGTFSDDVFRRAAVEVADCEAAFSAALERVTIAMVELAAMSSGLYVGNT